MVKLEGHQQKEPTAPSSLSSSSPPATMADIKQIKMAKSSLSSSSPPATMADMDHRDNYAWMYSFGAAMVPFTAFVYGHGQGMTARVVDRVVKSPLGVYGLFVLPFVTLGMEKCIYDTVQSYQGLNPNIVPADRGGFPSGGAQLPSFSLIAVQQQHYQQQQQQQQQ